jgi:hypothetical protein
VKRQLHTGLSSTFTPGLPSREPIGTNVTSERSDYPRARELKMPTDDVYFTESNRSRERVVSRGDERWLIDAIGQ